MRDLRLTIGIKKKRMLLFLDNFTINPKERILTDLHSKPTSTSKLLNFNLHHPLSQKINIIMNLKNKILNLSAPKFRNKNEQASPFPWNGELD